MTLDPSAAGLLALGGLALAVVLLAALLLRSRAADHDARVRLEQRLDDDERARAARDAALEQRMDTQERLRRAEQASLLTALERRLGEGATAQATTSAELRTALVERFERLQHETASAVAHGHARTVRAVVELQARFEQRQGETQKSMQDTLAHGAHALQRQVGDALLRSHEELGRRVDAMTRNTDERLGAISAQVEQRLSDGFEKTTATFQNVIERLALIDEAQKRITELTGSVVSLKEILADKRSRGAFGEVQLNALVANVMPASAYSLQHTLGNGRRADCVLFLPEPTGTIVIDAKFPLESFQRMTDLDAGEIERRASQRRFKSDVRTHIRDIAERYIVPGETSDGAIMFVPAEAVFAEIQARHPDVVQEAHRARVWMASPTTLVAILNTARAVLKDDATRKQVHVIRRHLAALAGDFERFRERMDRLATHMDQANRDVQQVHTSARKLSARFETIEKVEMEGDAAPPQAAGDDATPRVDGADAGHGTPGGATGSG